MRQVDVVKDTKEKAREVTSGGREKGSVGKKVLVSLAASAASGATAYAAGKAPGFFQDKVLPKLKELTSNGGAVEKAKKAVENAVPGIGDDHSPEAPRRSSRPRVSPAEAEKRRRERAEHRRERQAALSK
jgi:hypothetical protein